MSDVSGFIKKCDINQYIYILPKSFPKKQLDSPRKVFKPLQIKRTKMDIQYEMSVNGFLLINNAKKMFWYIL